MRSCKTGHRAHNRIKITKLEREGNMFVAQKRFVCEKCHWNSLHSMFHIFNMTRTSSKNMHLLCSWLGRWQWTKPMVKNEFHQNLDPIWQLKLREYYTLASGVSSPAAQTPTNINIRLHPRQTDWGETQTKKIRDTVIPWYLKTRSVKHPWKTRETSMNNMDNINKTSVTQE